MKMKKLHQHLENNLTWYKHWHESTLHKIVHFGILIFTLLFTTGLILSSTQVNAFATYYISPTGNDSNPGTITAPWKTFKNLKSVPVNPGDPVINPGDTIYVRGGTYTSNAGNNADVHFAIGPLNGTQANPINILAYPGEKPVFNLSNITVPAGKYPTAMWLTDSNWVNLKGFTVKNLQQDATGQGVSWGFQLWHSNHCKIELFDIYNIGGTGFVPNDSNDNLFLNNDSHNNGDGMSPDHWNFGDGFTIGTGGDTSNNNVFEGNRSWMNGDDGWDAFEWSGQKVTYKNNWSFWNSVKPWKTAAGDLMQPPATDAGMTAYDPSQWKNADGTFKSANNYEYLTSTGSGEGFKLGGCNYPQPQANCPTGAPTVVKKFLENNVSFGNVGTGYAANMDAVWSHRMSIINSLSFNNGNDGLGFGTGRSVGIAMIFKNDWAWNNNRLASGGNIVYDGNLANGSPQANNCPGMTGNNCPNISNNYWDTSYNNAGYPYPNPGNLKGSTISGLSAADFLSIDESLGVSPRQADGSLPNVNFLKLALGSKLIDKGVVVNNSAGVPISCNGSAPDLGPYESAGTPTGGCVTTGGDTTAPTNVSLLTPPTGVVFGINVQVSSQATDNIGVTKVEYYIDGTTTLLNCTPNPATTTPYSCFWNTTNTPNGNHTLTSKAYDLAGNSTFSSPVTVNVQNQSAVPDLTLVLSPNPLTITTVGSTANLSVTVKEIAGKATTTPINVRISKSSGFSVSLVSSPNWSLNSSNSSYYTLTSSTVIPTNGTSVITLKYTKNTQNKGTAPITARIVAGSGGQTITTNDVASVTLSYAGAVVNEEPFANAGPDQTITLPTSTVTLSGSGTDLDIGGSITAYAWQKVSGSGTITNSNQATTTITGLTAGTSTFKLTVTDNQNTTGSDTVTVTVNPASANNFTFQPMVILQNSNGLLVPQIAITSTNNIPITTVDFYLNTTKIGSDTSGMSPFDINGGQGYNSTQIANGTYSLTAKVTDNQGNTATSAPTSVVIGN